MTAAWITIAVLAVATAAIRAAGPIAVGERELSAPLQRVVALLAPALLAALVVTQTLGETTSSDVVVDERAAGVAAAGAVLAFKGPMLLAIAVAATVTAVLRALG